MDTCTYWVCVDCNAASANGDAHPRPDDVATFLLNEYRGVVTPGLMADEHYDDCLNFPTDPDTGERYHDGSHDDYCEDRGFSWSRCDGCGSTLGGSRHAFTYHYPD